MCPIGRRIGSSRRRRLPFVVDRCVVMMTSWWIVVVLV